MTSSFGYAQTNASDFCACPSDGTACYTASSDMEAIYVFTYCDNGLLLCVEILWDFFLQYFCRNFQMVAWRIWSFFPWLVRFPMGSIRWHLQTNGTTAHVCCHCQPMGHHTSGQLAFQVRFVWDCSKLPFVMAIAALYLVHQRLKRATGPPFTFDGLSVILIPK